jgi:hypothetical protein
VSFGDNTNPRPFEIIDAREAEYKASESQRKLADELADAHGRVADAEYAYRRALTARIRQLHEGGMAITMCPTVARGEESIAVLRRDRDKLQGKLAGVEQECFRAGADRRALDGLIDWSKRRDLRVDAEPHWDSKTGEIIGPRAVA